MLLSDHSHTTSRHTGWWPDQFNMYMFDPRPTEWPISNS